MLEIGECKEDPISCLAWLSISTFFRYSGKLILQFFAKLLKNEESNASTIYQYCLPLMHSTNLN